MTIRTLFFSLLCTLNNTNNIDKTKNDFARLNSNNNSYEQQELPKPSLDKTKNDPIDEAKAFYEPQELQEPPYSSRNLYIKNTTITTLLMLYSFFIQYQTDNNNIDLYLFLEFNKSTLFDSPQSLSNKTQILTMENLNYLLQHQHRCWHFLTQYFGPHFDISLYPEETDPTHVGIPLLPLYTIKKTDDFKILESLLRQYYNEHAYTQELLSLLNYHEKLIFLNNLLTLNYEKLKQSSWFLTILKNKTTKQIDNILLKKCTQNSIIIETKKSEYGNLAIPNTRTVYNFLFRTLKRQHDNNIFTIDQTKNFEALYSAFAERFEKI